MGAIQGVIGFGEKILECLEDGYMNMYLPTAETVGIPYYTHVRVVGIMLSSELSSIEIESTCCALTTTLVSSDLLEAGRRSSVKFSANN